ncbi:hypothetical protein SCLCIDRAFT_1001117 [Scleroderma citrinum Foug A]|uniref:Uncharacterized protein n=1 Tax=Scleroderma citrinum Foug A TaxID=1036808 RepID=A0A0C3A396_9AGAM|nr:hypothetical protein SCLCIDRAFT_1001117 [Scleroderma citrinum Foug A]
MLTGLKLPIDRSRHGRSMRERERENSTWPEHEYDWSVGKAVTRDARQDVLDYRDRVELERRPPLFIYVHTTYLFVSKHDTKNLVTELRDMIICC